jgi:hypothetical protein
VLTHVEHFLLGFAQFFLYLATDPVEGGKQFTRGVLVVFVDERKVSIDDFAEDCFCRPRGRSPITDGDDVGSVKVPSGKFALDPIGPLFQRQAPKIGRDVVR